MLGLRTENGVSISALYKYLDENQKVKFKSKLNSLIKDGLLTFKNNCIKIPQNKWLLSEYVSREFFILNE
jgi:coproporphyrinogen III oxidase-like Fe-S oxidoreductase